MEATDVVSTPFASFTGFLGWPGSLRPPIARELLALRHRTGAKSEPVSPPEGRGRTALLIPGFMANDRTMGPLAAWLRDGGWTVHGAGQASSECGAVVADRMSKRLHEVSADGPVTVVGHSRGGQIGQMLAVRFAGEVDRVVAIGSPLTDPFAMHLAVRLLAATCAALARLGVKGLVDRCPYGECCQSYHYDVVARSGRPLTCLYSLHDGIVDWRACMREDAVNIEVGSTHLGMPNHAVTRRVLAEVLRPEAAISTWINGTPDR